MQFLRFAIVGCAGFVVDTAALYVAMHILGVGLYIGRAFSYLTAASSTWFLNRQFTFGDRRDHNLWREWSKFLAANALGGAINYLVYAALVAGSQLVAAWPVLGIGAGSIAGLLINFALSKHIVFTSAKSKP